MSYLQTLPRNNENEYVMPNGTEWSDPKDAMLHFLFGLPLGGTGYPDEALLVVRDGLRLRELAHDSSLSGSSFGMIKADLFGERFRDFTHARARQLGLEFVLWYVLEGKGLIDYGSSVGAPWLTPLGESVLADLEEMGLGT